LCWRVLYRGLRATLRDKKPEPAAAAANAGPLASVAGLDFSGFLEAHGRSALILLGGAIGFVAPWAISHRDSYIYHFLPSYVLLVMLLAGFVAREARTTLVISFLSLVLVVLAFYAPIWSMFETSSRAVNLRLFLPVWR
jgi:dolichyl-phosphate-mannose--protein O-mannosyl transferase